MKPTQTAVHIHSHLSQSLYYLLTTIGRDNTVIILPLRSTAGIDTKFEVVALILLIVASYPHLFLNHIYNFFSTSSMPKHFLTYPILTQLLTG